MRNALVGLLITCATTAQAVEPGTAASMSPLPAGLPAPEVLDDGTVCLPSPLADAVDTQREECRQLGPRNQARLDALAEQCAAEVAAKVDEALAQVPPPAPGHSTEMVAAVAAGAALVGALLVVGVFALAS
jgi:hypothetical protein